MSSKLRIGLAVLALLIGGVFASAGSGQPGARPEAPGWCEAAKRHLMVGGQPAICETLPARRCPMMNNYWCIAQSASNPWRGTPSAQGRDGLSDGHHAIFSDPKWAARAVAKDLRAKYRGGFTSAWAIADRYSPACDTLGTVGVRNGVGRSCSGGPQPPAGFVGPRCPIAPKTKSACVRGCNCPPQIAETLVRDLNVGTGDDLKLFDAAGRPTANLAIVIRNLGRQEIGATVSDALIAEGIALMDGPT